MACEEKVTAITITGKDTGELQQWQPRVTVSLPREKNQNLPLSSGE